MCFRGKIVFSCLARLFLLSLVLNLGGFISAEGEELSPESMAKMEEKLKKIELEKVKQYKHLSQIYENEGQFQEAVKMCRKILELKPEEVRLYSKIGELYQKAEMYREALAVYGKVIRNYPHTKYATEAQAQMKVLLALNLIDVYKDRDWLNDTILKKKTRQRFRLLQVSSVRKTISHLTPAKELTKYANVLAIDGDNPQVLWLATEQGVRRFDTSANDWTTLSGENSLNSSKVDYLAVEPGEKSPLWIAISKSIFMYDKRQGELISFKGLNLRGKVKSLLLGPPGNSRLYFQTEVSVLEYNKELNIWREFATGKGGELTNLRLFAFDPTYPELIWGGNEKEIGRYDSKKEEWSIYTLGKDLRKQLPSNFSIRWVIPDSYDKRYIWIGTDKSFVIRYDQNTNEFRDYFTYLQQFDMIPLSAESIAFDEDYVWVGTNKGLHAYERRYNDWVRFAIDRKWLDVLVKQIAVAPENPHELWFLTRPPAQESDYAGAGLYRFNKAENSWTAFPLK